MAASKTPDERMRALYTRVEPALDRRIKQEVRRRQKASQGVSLSQADVIRALLWEALNATKKGPAT